MSMETGMSQGLLFQAGKFLVIAGVVFVVLGLLLMMGSRFSFFGLGRLPGDISYKGKNVTFYFPIVTSIVLSVLLTLALWLVSLFARK
jgi:hypothetical protein